MTSATFGKGGDGYGDGGKGMKPRNVLIIE